MALSDAVAAQIMGELHDLTKAIEAQATNLDAVANKVVDAAKEINAARPILHKQNEAALMQKVALITDAVNQLKGMNDGMQQATRKQADATLSPTVTALSESLKNQTDRELSAAKLLNRCHDLQEKITARLILFVGVSFVGGLIALLVGIFIGRLTK